MRREHGNFIRKNGRGCNQEMDVDPITCVIDSSKAGKSVSEVCNIDKHIPIENIDEAFKFGAEVLLLGTAPSITSRKLDTDHWSIP